MASVADEVFATAQVKKGKLYIRDRETFDQAIQRLDDRWMLEVIVRRLRATRSQRQNRAYWGLTIAAISEHTGYHPEEVHELLKQMFLPKKLAVCDGNGEVKGEFVMGGSTRNLNTAEFMEYTNRIQQWAAEELHIVIPDPDAEVAL